MLSITARRPNQAFLLSIWTAAHTIAPAARHIDRTKSRFQSGGGVVTIWF
ncbi:MAG: hypothetical protein GAK33_06269 [Burkholderia lata]|uniref:Uncharacterized protein n=1 Tax=Burkholderia lata (strain ATCC 17760 / DSM 23089 / LMG 22485 / NCIMB 9086 / R18194 / 383) TaxID=482957 RepID=A0A833PJ42_BURL3|nr:MAG: hypothetical protein GAK33_06269 [Burkholderia lata]